MSIEKRVDLRMEYGYRVRGKRTVRGKAYADDNGDVVIVYNDNECSSFSELKAMLPNLRAVVTGDKALRDALKARGFVVEDPDKRKTPMHVTIDTRLFDLIEDEAQNRGCYVSKVVTDILNEYYHTDFD